MSFRVVMQSICLSLICLLRGEMYVAIPFVAFGMSPFSNFPVELFWRAPKTRSIENNALNVFTQLSQTNRGADLLRSFSDRF